MINVLLVNLYPESTVARYLLSSYLLKGYAQQELVGRTGVKIEVLNMPAKRPVERVVSRIVQGQPAVVGYSCYSWNIENILTIAGQVRQHLPGVVQLAGGPELSQERIRTFSDPSVFNFFVVGEGERAFADILRRLLDVGLDHTASIPGVVRWKDGELLAGGPARRLNDLDEVPSVYMNGILDERLYERNQAFVETQRGCRFNCRYCVYHKNLSGLSFYSLDRVRKELDYLICEKRVTALRFLDGIFTSDLERAKAIQRHLIELRARGVKLPWMYWEITLQSVDDEFLQLAAALKNRASIRNYAELKVEDRPQLYSEMLDGYTVINCVGLQSMNPAALKAVRRPTAPKEFLRRFFDGVRKYNLVLKLDLILGLPEETPESYWDGLEQLLPEFDGNDHVLNIHRLQILPGSELEALCECYGIRYGREAPHLVTETAQFTAAELEYSSRLTALLFRVVNCPLRERLFNVRRTMARPYRELMERLLVVLTPDLNKRGVRLVGSAPVDDEYWNDAMFREIPSVMLVEALETLSHEA